MTNLPLHPDPRASQQPLGSPSPCDCSARTPHTWEESSVLRRRLKIMGGRGWCVAQWVLCPSGMPDAPRLTFSSRCRCNCHQAREVEARASEVQSHPQVPRINKQNPSPRQKLKEQQKTKATLSSQVYFLLPALSLPAV